MTKRRLTISLSGISSALGPLLYSKMNYDPVKGIQSPEFVNRMTGLGYNILGGTPEQMSERISADTKYWSPVVKALRAGGARFD